MEAVVTSTQRPTRLPEPMRLRSMVSLHIPLGPGRHRKVTIVLAPADLSPSETSRPAEPQTWRGRALWRLLDLICTDDRI